MQRPAPSNRVRRLLRIGAVACSVAAIVLWLWNWHAGSDIGFVSYLLVAVTGGLLWASTLWADEA